jgi:ankyrin repeat protein
LGQNTNLKIEDDSSLLHFAVAQDSLEIARLCFTHKIKLFFLFYLKNNYNRDTLNIKGLTPLSMAIVLNRSELVLDILAAGADVNFSNKDGWLP